MSDIVIRAEGLGKRYRRGLTGPPETLRDALTRLIKSPLAAARRASQEHFWALRDVGLEVRHGEVLGLIGRNGAGKTTLLKILSRITRPTTGWAEIHGRVRSLLEVGTGFHGELSGRENTYLSGSILGMGKREIDRKFDEIVAFAEIDKFIDTPVKHYSSGMYVRLAFAVAAHLEPEILLVDEVLAVGDINFQKKCLGKMGDVAKAGRTIVLVSHQMNQMRRLCNRIVWIDAGNIRMDGAAHEIISSYESAMSNGDALSHSGEIEGRRQPSARGRFLRWEIAEPRSEEAHMLNALGPVSVKFTIAIYQHLKKGHHGVALYNHDRQLIFGHAIEEIDLPVGEHEFCHDFPMLPLRPGSYTWRVSLYNDYEPVDDIECTPGMIVASDPVTHPKDEWSGILNLPSVFSISSKAESPK
jgi:ABC-type polysaccharide/polyol phosphate transport system ATPase subunit